MALKRIHGEYVVDLERILYAQVVQGISGDWQLIINFTSGDKCIIHFDLMHDARHVLRELTDE